jgi:hypothetical protein
MGDETLAAVDELPHAEGLQEVVVRAGAQRVESFLGRDRSGQNEDRKPLEIDFRSKSAHEFQATRIARKLVLGNDDVGSLAASELEGARGVDRVQHLELGTDEIACQNARQLGIGLYEENAKAWHPGSDTTSKKAVRAEDLILSGHGTPVKFAVRTGP